MANEWDVLLQDGGTPAPAGEWDHLLDEPAYNAGHDRAPSPSQYSPRDEGLDVLKTTASWPIRGILGTAGIPGDVEQAGIWATNKLTGKESGSQGYLPTSDSLMANFRKANPQTQDYIAHEPTTPGGKIVGFTEDVIGPGFGNKAKNIKAVSRAENVIKTAPAEHILEAAKNAKYKEVHDAGIHYDGKLFGDWMGMLGDKLEGHNLAEKTGDMVHDLLESGDRAKLGGPVSLNKIESFRRRAGEIWADPKTSYSDRSAIGVLRNELDYFAENADNVTGVAKSAEGKRLLGEARELAKRHIRDRQLGEALSKAQNFPEQEQGAQLRIPLRAMMKKDHVYKTYTPEQRDAIKKTFDQAKPERLTRIIGTQLAGQAIASTAHLAGPYAGIAANLAAPAIARKAEKYLEHRAAGVRNALMEKNVAETRAEIRLKPGQVVKKTPGKIATSNIIRALLSGKLAADDIQNY